MLKTLETYIKTENELKEEIGFLARYSDCIQCSKEILIPAMRELKIQPQLELFDGGGYSYEVVYIVDGVRLAALLIEDDLEDIKGDLEGQYV